MIEFAIKAFLDTISTILKLAFTSAIVFLFSLVVYYIRRQDKLFYGFIVPKKRVLKNSFDIKDYTNINTYKIEEKVFENPYNDEERKKLLFHSTGKVLFNGEAVRLNSISNNQISLSKVNFYDFLTTNLIIKPASSNLLNPYDVIWHTIFDEEFKERNKLENKLKAKIKWYGKLNTFNKILNVKELANIIAVSVVLRDINNNVLIVQRSNKNAISSGSFVVSSTGSVAWNDINESNPFVFAGQREVKEELNIDVSLKITDIVIVKQKYQPIVYLEGKINDTFKKYIDKIKQAKDFNDENTSIYSVPDDKIIGVVKKYKFSDASSYQLVGECSSLRWLFTKKVNIKKYKL